MGILECVEREKRDNLLAKLMTSEVRILGTFSGSGTLVYEKISTFCSEVTCFGAFSPIDLDRRHLFHLSPLKYSFNVVGCFFIGEKLLHVLINFVTNWQWYSILMHAKKTTKIKYWGEFPRGYTHQVAENIGESVSFFCILHLYYINTKFCYLCINMHITELYVTLSIFLICFMRIKKFTSIIHDIKRTSNTCSVFTGKGKWAIKFKLSHFQILKISSTATYYIPKQVVLLWQRDRATRLSVENLQLKYPYRMALFAWFYV